MTMQAKYQEFVIIEMKDSRVVNILATPSKISADNFCSYLNSMVCMLDRDQHVFNVHRVNIVDIK